MLEVSKQGDGVMWGRGEHGGGMTTGRGAATVKWIPQDEKSWAPRGGRRTASQAEGTAHTKVQNGRGHTGGGGNGWSRRAVRRASSGGSLAADSDLDGMLLAVSSRESHGLAPLRDKKEPR